MIKHIGWWLTIMFMAVGLALLIKSTPIYDALNNSELILLAFNLISLERWVWWKREAGRHEFSAALLDAGWKNAERIVAQQLRDSE